MSIARKFVLFLCLASFAVPASASGHGPVFGYATPVNSKGEWSFDVAFDGRNWTTGTDAILRSMVSYGFTPHVQWSLVVPGVISQQPATPAHAMGGGDWESDLAWRFHHNASAVGTRIESTLTAGIVVPAQRPAGVMGALRRAPGVNASLATGMASRSHYLWAGAGYTYFVAKQGDQRPGVFSYSGVWGYRPPAWRKQDYPHWDWRLFAEMTGEVWGHAQHAGAAMLGTEGHQIFLGPSTLGIYKTFAVSGGVQFPVYRDVGSAFPRERVRFALNLSYFLFTNRQHHGD
jgi:hypothetical protein